MGVELPQTDGLLQGVKVSPRQAKDDPGRSESEEERDDRNVAELLQELRVASIGVQVLFGFLLSLPFSARFGRLDLNQRHLYLAVVLLAASSTAQLSAPVAYHRMVFRRHRKAQLLRVANVLGTYRFGHRGVGDLWCSTSDREHSCHGARRAPHRRRVRTHVPGTVAGVALGRATRRRSELGDCADVTSLGGRRSERTQSQAPPAGPFG